MAPRTSTPTPIAYVVGALCVVICVWGIRGDGPTPTGPGDSVTPAVAAGPVSTPGRHLAGDDGLEGPRRPAGAALADLVRHATLEAVPGTEFSGTTEGAQRAAESDATAAPSASGHEAAESRELTAEPTEARRHAIDPPGSGTAPHLLRPSARQGVRETVQLAAASPTRTREEGRRPPLVDLLDGDARAESLRKRSFEAAHTYWTTGGLGRIRIVLDRSLDDFAAATRDGVRYEVHLNPDLLENQPRAVAEFFERHEYGHAYLGHPVRTSGHPWVDEHAADAFAASLMWFQQGTAPVQEVIEWLERQNAPATRTHPSYRLRARYLRSVLEALDTPGRNLPDPPAVSAATLPQLPANGDALERRPAATRTAAAGLAQATLASAAPAPVMAAREDAADAADIAVTTD